MNYLVLNYNNYFNRIVKKEETLSDYVDAANDSTAYYNLNFQEGDLVNTQVVLNFSSLETFTPDYFICFTGDLSTGTIVSRWFITDSQRTRKGQYQLTLRRDLIVDNYNAIINAKTFIEKATVPFTNNLIFNSENMSYNQIKKSETELYDKTAIAWLVGYMTPKLETAITGTVANYTNPYPTISSTFADWIYNKYTTADSFKLPVNTTYTVRAYKSFTTASIGDSYNYVFTSTTPVDTSWYGSMSNLLFNVDTLDKSWFNFDTLNNLIATKWSLNTTTEYQDLKTYDGNTYQFTDGVYSFKLVENTETTTLNSGDVDNTDTVGSELYNKIRNVKTTASQNGKPFKYSTTVKTYTLVPTKVSSTVGYTYTIPTSVRKLEDAPYRMFCIPYPVGRESMHFYRSTGQAPITFDIDTKLMLDWATQIAIDGTTSSIYDIQILPYCPIDNTSIYSLGNYLQDNKYGTENVDYLYLKNSDGDKFGICYFSNRSTFKAPLYKLSGTTLSTINISITDYKQESETDMYRLCSPNYNGVFEFNAAKNDGIRNLEADCTYKPYNPYIHVHPEFNRMYGTNYEDSRGLVCSGDFSISIISDAWKQYELNNKNYQAIFNRQIQNMDVNNSIQMTQQIVSSLTGSLTGGLSGGAAGSIAIGGPVATGVGAGVGTAASIIGGIADTAILSQQQAESKSFAIDNYGYQLGNVKALPESISKVTAFNVNNKYFPFLEYYTCSDEEKTALANKLTYDGMTVMAIGCIKDYQQVNKTFIRGKLIRMEDTNNDNHEIENIAQELSKGVFI